jgi:RNA polymerase sigma-70 factor (ECF subfamily)
MLLEVKQSVNVIPGLPGAAANEDVPDERWLVAKAKSGSHDAFGELYKRHRLKAHRTALRILHNQQDSEDAVQRAFQRALVNLERFREDSTFSTWLIRITINEALMMLRRHRSREPLLEGSIDPERGDHSVEIVDGRPTPEEILCETERRAKLMQAIGKLRENLRIVLLHKELQGLTAKETAQILGLTVSAVKARIFHARRFLRKYLERKFVGAELLARPQKRKA